MQNYRPAPQTGLQGKGADGLREAEEARAWEVKWRMRRPSRKAFPYHRRGAESREM